MGNCECYEMARDLWISFKSEHDSSKLIEAARLLEDCLGQRTSDMGLVAKSSWLYYVVVSNLDPSKEKNVRRYADYAITLDSRYNILDNRRLDLGDFKEVTDAFQ